MRTRFQHFFSFDMRVRLQGTFGRPRRRNICAPHPILDGRRLGNHPFYRCSLKNSSAHAFPAVSLAREACPPKCEPCFGGACRRNICAPNPILDGRRLANHPFYRCPLKNSSAHAAPECRAHPRQARLSQAAASAERADEIYALRIRFLMVGD